MEDIEAKEELTEQFERISELIEIFSDAEQKLIRGLTEKYWSELYLSASNIADIASTELLLKREAKAPWLRLLMKVAMLICIGLIGYVIVTAVFKLEILKFVVYIGFFVFGISAVILIGNFWLDFQQQRRIRQVQKAMEQEE